MKAILSEIATRLQAVGGVIGREHSWLKPQVDLSRQTNDDNTDYELDIGVIDEEEAEQQRSEDNLTLKREQVDKHLENLLRAEEIVNEIAVYIRKGLATGDQDGANG